MEKCSQTTSVGVGLLDWKQTLDLLPLFVSVREALFSILGMHVLSPRIDTKIYFREVHSI
jgi:hypothetical protein